jgi:transposase
MYIKTKCKCGRQNFHNVSVRVRQDGSDLELDGIDVKDSVEAEQLAREILLELQGYVYDGITTRQLCKVLKDNFGVAFQYCCDIVQRLKIELDMYCPDKQHLYYVETL